jgi:rRNA small subunit pseudouridine methyltransferase Nep1
MIYENKKDGPELTIVLAESEIERIPPSIQGHPQIKSYARSRGKHANELLLDASYHHAAMKSLPDASRRGRPDIVHRCVLSALDSWANQRGKLHCYIHTRDDYVIWMNPETRLPRQYHRFVGLMEQLMKQKKITHSDEVLLSFERKTLKQLLEEIDGEQFLLWEKAEKTSLLDAFKQVKENRITIVIGGFPHGDFHQARNLIDHTISFEENSFSASYLLAKSIFSFEQVFYDH